MRITSIWLRNALPCLFLAALCGSGSAQTPADRIAAYGQVCSGERIVTLAIPSFMGAPQTIAELLVKEGDRVTPKQQLATTNNRALAAADLELAKTRLKAGQKRLENVQAGPKSEDLAAQEALIRSLEADARAETAKKRSDTEAKSREVLARQESLEWKVKMAQRQLEAMRVRPTDVAIAQAEVEEVEAAFQRAQVLLLSTEIFSPMEGQVLKILSYPGEGGAGQGLLEIGDIRSMQVKAEINVTDATRVAPGAKAMVKSNAWPGEMAGTVTRIRPKVERSVLSAPSTFSNVDRIVVEATIALEAPEKLAGLSGAEVTVLITVGPTAK
jgi:HlyD family secretion protein